MIEAYCCQRVYHFVSIIRPLSVFESETGFVFRIEAALHASDLFVVFQQAQERTERLKKVEERADEMQENAAAFGDAAR